MTVQMARYWNVILICLLIFKVVESNRTIKGKYNRIKLKDFEVVVPRRVNEEGEHISYKVSKRNSGKVHYVVPISGEDHHLELVENHNVLNPGVIVETYDGEGGLNGVKFRRSGNKQCHFVGSVRGHNDSAAAVSTCDGLAGYIRTKRGLYLIEPIDGDQTNRPRAHLVQFKQTNGVSEMLGVTKRDKDYLNKHLYIEILVVLDRAFINYRKGVDIEDYVITLFNMANGIFNDGSLDLNIHLVIVRMIRLEYREHEINSAASKGPAKLLEYFRRWQKKINPKEEEHPNHHDVAILLTRIDNCRNEKTCGLLGAAKLSGICDPENQAAICEDIGLRMGFLIAHEIGHTLGLVDEFALNGTVMSLSANLYRKFWSENSNKYLKQYFNSGLADCLYDWPTTVDFEHRDVLPGVMYDAIYQCRELFGNTAELCNTAIDCNNLMCYLEDKGCVESRLPAAEGTRCGENKWCFHGECVEVGERPGVVDGGWGDWSKWSECTRTCGSGVTTQQRYCNNPKPAHGGRYCEGEHRRYRICSTEPCELEERSFRDLQCAEFNAWIFPEDKKVHEWRSYPIRDENPCALFCVNDVGYVASLRPKVIDGTSCYRGARDICINGLCKEIPCDLNLNSGAVEDRCGVCRGDGLSCDVHRGERFFNDDTKGDQLMFVIPKGAFNVRIEELLPSESTIKIKSPSNGNVLVSELRMVPLDQMRIWIGMIRNKQEAVSIKEPINQPLEISINVKQQCSFSYYYATKFKIPRHPNFRWEYLKWTICSSVCGTGTQESVPKCSEEIAGLVDDVHCMHLKKPTEKIRICEQKPCKPMWFVGDWSNCTKCPNGIRTRVVRCFKQSGADENILDFIQESYCLDGQAKPKISENCLCEEKYTYNKHKEEDACEIFNNTIETTTMRSPIETIIDFQSIKNLKLAIHPEIDDGVMTNLITSDNHSYEIEGKAVLKFMHLIQTTNNTKS